jgi:hypothetical protein
MRDIPEGARVDNGRSAFACLDEIREKCIAQESGHTAHATEGFGSDRTSLPRHSDQHPRQSPPQIFGPQGKGEDGHYFGSLREDEFALSVAPVRTHKSDMPEGTITETHDARPSDTSWIHPQGIAMEQVVVEHGGQEIVCRRHGMSIPRTMEIDFLAGHKLGATATGPSALDPEYRTQRRLAQRDNRPLAKP